MKATKLSITFVTSLALVGTAAADAHKEKMAQADKKPGATPATPASPAKGGGTVAPATPAPPAKGTEAPKKMEIPKPPAELTAMGKTLNGTWKCTGKALDMNTNGMGDMKGTMTFKVDTTLDKWWITGTMKMTGAMPFKGTMYATYDPVTKKWHRMMMDSWGASMTESSDGGTDKVVWTGDGRAPMPGMTTHKTRTTETIVGPKNVKMVGEASMDGGKTWVTGWEADCKK